MRKNINSSNGKKQDLVKKATKSKAKPKQKLEVRNLLHKLEAAKKKPKRKATEKNVEYYIGIDLGDKQSYYCILDKNANIAAEGNLATTVQELELYFKAIPRSRIALEVGTHSPWISPLLEDLGHVVYVANPRKIGGGKKSRRRKNDKLDAEALARQVKSDPRMLYPIQHRGQKARQALVLLRTRHALVCARTSLICTVRGMVKSDGRRLPKCSTMTFHNMERSYVPEALQEALEPLFKQIGLLTEQIKKYDKEVKRMCRQAYPETDLLQQVNGVGELVSLAFVLTVDNPRRFAKSRDVGAYMGLIPRQYDSGDSRPQMRITKTGDRMMRQLLTQSAQYILGPFGKDSDLKRHGLKIAARGGKNAKKRATVAVARKLSVLLHSLWITGEVYEPLRNSEPQQRAA